MHHEHLCAGYRALDPQEGRTSHLCEDLNTALEARHVAPEWHIIDDYGGTARFFHGAIDDLDEILIAKAWQPVPDRSVIIQDLAGIHCYAHADTGELLTFTWTRLPWGLQESIFSLDDVRVWVRQ